MRNCLALVGFIVFVILLIVGVYLLLSWVDLASDVEEAVFPQTQDPTLSALETRAAAGADIQRTYPLGESNPPPFQLPTPTIDFTPTPIPDPVVYRTEVLIRARSFASALDSFYGVNGRLQEDPELLDDPAWQNEMRTILDNLVETAYSMGQVPVPEEYRDINDWLVRVGPEATALRESYLNGILTENEQDFRDAGESLQRIIEYMRQAEQAMLEAGWP